jgi:phospholipid/cholesterol/gamma-HCH transport system substrate-binding protein
VARFTTEAKVGVFGLVALGILFYLSVSIGIFEGFRGKPARTLVTHFSNASGLEVRSNVKVAGVHVGKVEAISLERGRARVVIRLEEDVELHEGAAVEIKTEGFLGEKFLDIYPGQQDAPPLKDGAVLKPVSEAADVDKLIAKLTDVAGDIENLTKPLGEMLGDEEGLNRFHKAFDTVSKLTDNLDKELFGKGNRFKLFIDNMEDASIQLKTFSEESLPQIKSTFSRLDNISAQIEARQGTLGKLVYDDELYADLKDALGGLKDARGKFDEVLSGLQTISKKVESGEGSLAKFLNDDGLYEQTRDTITTINTIVKRVEAGEGTIGRLYTDETLYVEAERALKKVGRAAEDIEEQTPISALGVVLGFIF